MNEMELKKLLSGSKERNPSVKGENVSRRKREYELVYAKNIHNKPKDMGSHLNHTLNQTTKIAKTYLHADKSHSNGKLKQENTRPDPKLKVLETLKLELRKYS